MAKKSMKEAAAAGTSVFDTIAQGAQYAEGAQNVNDVMYAQNAQDAPAERGGRPKKYDVEMTRLSLKIPLEIKEYLMAAAYRESSPKHMVSLTEYLVNLVREDMEKHKRK